jgi:hypothetical protein
MPVGLGGDLYVQLHWEGVQRSFTERPVKKGGLTAAGRKALSIAMKKRWAKKKAAAKGKAA